MNPEPVIYALQDPRNANLIKIGKDMKWPQRLRQAQSHTPSIVAVVGVWSLTSQSPDEVGKRERQLHHLFQRAVETDGREWFIASPNDVISEISAVLGSPSETLHRLAIKPFDDWRDFANPTRSTKRRRLWIGLEELTGRIKVVHSPHITEFASICPTYNCFRLRWRECWECKDERWMPTDTLNWSDRAVIGVWQHIANSFGYGEHDTRVGWLTESVTMETVRNALIEKGLRNLELAKLMPDMRGTGFAIASSVLSI